MLAVLFIRMILVFGVENGYSFRNFIEYRLHESEIDGLNWKSMHYVT